MATARSFEAQGEIEVDGRTEIRLEPGDHAVRTRAGINLRVREGCALVGVEGGFNLLCVDLGERPGTTPPFHASVQLNPNGVGRLRIEPGKHVVFDVLAA